MCLLIITNLKEITMLKLYFSPGACCMSCHIVLEELQIPFELVYVGKKADPELKKLYLKLNPLGAVPAIVLEDGRILTQNIAILEYLADQKPELALLGQPGSYERAETMRWLSLVATDLHKSFSPLFRLALISSNKEAQADIKKWSFDSIDKYLTIINDHLKDKTTLSMEKFTIADAYLFTVYQWASSVSLPTEKYTDLNRYSDTIARRQSVKQAIDREHQYK